MKILCISNKGGNNKTLARALSIKEVNVDARADSALLKNGKPFFVPDFMGRLGLEAQIALRVSKLGKTVPLRFAPRYYDAATLAVTFTATELRDRLRAEGCSDTLATSFDGSVCLGNWLTVEELGPQDYWHYSLKVNGAEAQAGAVKDLPYSFDEVISYVSRFFTLKTGDIILTGATTADTAVHIDDELQGTLNGKPVLRFACK